jgi:eukaryotic-like serine/threonine-protein kinase
MSFSPGARLGPYAIVSTLGAGGMGEVYRATDTNLRRDVAIKVLPNAFAQDHDRLARFEREARTLASLNHPHIAQIYGLEKSDGVSALVMELVDGEDLSERIARGAIPLEDALPIARQIAEALEAAHEQGIVHRDLKPANIKLRPDGTVKVLDFGLAKLSDRSADVSSGPGALSLSPTIASPVMTGVGTLLGTCAYMSPEQARGRTVGTRADIWAFGCVLFEMLTGSRAFPGDDVTDTIAAIVKGEPDWNRLPASTPAGIRRLIRWCLQKDLKQRLAHIADARRDMDDALVAEPPAPGPSSAIRSKWSAAVPWSAAILTFVVAVSFLAWRERGRTTVAPPVMRLELNLPAGIELFSSARTIAVSPDSQRLVFVGVLNGSRQLYMRRLDRFGAEAMRGTDGATTCFFAPDGRSVGFVTFSGQLKIVSLADGLVAKIADNVSFLYGGAWALDGRLVFPRDGVLWEIARSGGTPKRLTTISGDSQESRHAWPTLLPGGTTMLFGVDVGGRWRIDALDLVSGARQTVIENGTLPLYVASGHLVFFRDAQLIAAPFDARGVRVTGPTVQMLDGLPALAPGIPLLDVAVSGSVVYSPTTAVSRLVWVSRTGEEVPLNDERRIYSNPRLAPDGQRVAVQAGDVWMQDLSRATFTRVTTGQIVSNGFPMWTPDGRRVLYRSTSGLRLQDINDGGNGTVIPGTNEFDYPAAFTPDGSRLVFLRTSADGSLDILTLALSDPAKIQTVVATPAYEGGARLSADGHWLTYVSNETGRNEIYLRPFPGPGDRWQVSTGGGTQAIWNPNGKEIFYRSDEKMMAVDVTTTPAVKLSRPRLLFEQRYLYGGGVTIANYDISRDGQRFVMVKADATAGRLNVVLNWFADPRRLSEAPN